LTLLLLLACAPEEKGLDTAAVTETTSTESSTDSSTVTTPPVDTPPTSTTTEVTTEVTTGLEDCGDDLWPADRVVPDGGVLTDRDSYARGDVMEVRWSGLDGVYAFSEVTLAEPGADDPAGIMREVAGRGSSNGCVRFLHLPQSCGLEPAVQGSGDAALAVGPSVTVDCDDGPMTLRLDRASYDVDEPILVSFSNSPGWPLDFITVVERGAPPNPSGLVHFADFYGAYEGEVELDLGYPAGDYDVVFCRNYTVEELARVSLTITD
jgi:hypothetical protein